MPISRTLDTIREDVRQRMYDENISIAELSKRSGLTQTTIKRFLFEKRGHLFSTVDFIVLSVGRIIQMQSQGRRPATRGMNASQARKFLENRLH